jgi:hypothetical protein
MELLVLPALTADEPVRANCLGAANKNLKAWMIGRHVVLSQTHVESYSSVLIKQPETVHGGPLRHNRENLTTSFDRRKKGTDRTKNQHPVPSISHPVQIFRLFPAAFLSPIQPLQSGHQLLCVLRIFAAISLSSIR